MNKLEIKYININDIKPYKKNPRINENAIPFVMESIKKFGFKNPVILDKNNVIVCGHTRIKSAEKLGIKEIPCIYADDLTEEQVKAFRLADNKVSEKAEWDLDLLNDELFELKELDFDMDVLGFEDVDLNNSSIVNKKEKDDSIIYFDLKEIENNIVEYWQNYNCLEDYIKNIIDIPTAKYQFNRLCQGYRDGYNISLLFNPHRLTTDTKTSKNIFYAIQNDEKYRQNFARFLINVQNKCVTQCNYFKYIGLGHAGYQYVNEFQPYLAREIYKKYCDNGFKILNPCAGWGGRLIGLASCRFKDIEYVETDPSIKTYNGLIKLKEFLKLSNNYKQYNLPFEELDVKENYFDFVFTSPPYFDTEHYSNEATQSYKKNKNYEDWKNNFLFKMIDKIIYSLKYKGKCLLNVGDKRYSISSDIKEYLLKKYNIIAMYEDFALDNNEDTDAIRSSEEKFILFVKE